MELTLEAFTDEVSGFQEFWAARDIVKEAIKNRTNFDVEGRAIFLDHFCPWKKHLYMLEEENFDNLSVGQVLYCVYKGSGENDYRIQCVSQSENSFENRKSLPESWCGIRGDELVKVSNINDINFCHVSGFIGGAKSRPAVLKMLEKALE